MSTTDYLIPLLKKLRLSGVLQSLELRTRQATDDDLGHGEFLFRILSDEVERRDAKQLESRIRRASFEGMRTLEDFDFHFNPEIPKAKIIDLATCSFVERHENVLLVGRTGVGKSHIAQALGHRACRAGYHALYTSAHDMLTSLRAARADASYDRKLLRLTSPDLLVIDDLGLRPLSSRRAARPLRDHPAALPARLYDHLVESRRGGMVPAVRRCAARERRDGPAAPQRPRRGDERRHLPQPATGQEVTPRQRPIGGWVTSS